MKKLLFVLLVVAVAGTIGLVSCGSSGGSDDLSGTWLATGEDGGVGKAVIFEVTSSSFTRIVFTEEVDDMIQEEGQKGQYSTSGDDISISISSEWDDGTAAWMPASENPVLPYSYDGTTLTLEVEPGLQVPFNRIAFTRHSNLAGTSWASGELGFNSDGTYTYDDGAGYTASGTWSATADMLRTITTLDNGSSMYVENLYDYEIQGTELVLLWDGDEKLRY